MDWKKELKKIIENGCTDSDIEDFAAEHPNVNGKDIWNYVSKLNAPKQCKGCKYIGLIGMGRCLFCSRKPSLKDYYEHR